MRRLSALGRLIFAPAVLLGFPLGAMGAEPAAPITEAKPSAEELAAAEARLEVAKKNGGGADTEAAVERALAWLARNKEPDGGWKAGAKMPCADLAMTAFAVLAFEGAGYTHKSGKYESQVRKGLERLMAGIKSLDVDAWRGDRPSGSNDPQGAEAYALGIVTWALAEACLRTDEPEMLNDASYRQERRPKAAATPFDEGLRAAAQRGADLIWSRQMPGHAWIPYYFGKTEHGDTSLTIYNCLALKTAQLAGLRVEKKVFEDLRVWLEESQDSSGRFAYRYGTAGGKGGGSLTMTAAGAAMRLLTGAPPSDWRVTRPADLVLAGARRTPDIYFLFHATVPLHQLGGERWKQWNQLMKPTLLSAQLRGGPDDGSWGPSGYARYKVMSTALGAMTLEIYYRNLRVYRQLAAQSEPAWEYLESGLARAAKEKRPAVVVFTTKDHQGPDVFGSDELREALVKSKAVPIKVLPPEALPLPPSAKPDEVRAEQDAHRQALAQYREIARKYGVGSANPTLVFVKPDGEAFYLLAAPDAATLKRVLEAVPGASAEDKRPAR